MEKKQLTEIESKARQMRILQCEMSRAFACYIGSSLSVTDILATLYFSIMNFDANYLADPKRDVLILSKGHASPALYAALHLKGLVKKEDLINHSTLRSPIYYHPSKKNPGVELATGSLGQGLSFGLGVALAQRQNGYDSRTFVILGDGELNEGSNWEAILAAPAFKLGNLVAIVDRNGRQANKATEELIPLGDLEVKWRAFGWESIVVDGHNISALHDTLDKSKMPGVRPLVVIARTIRDKGIGFLEDRQDAWCMQLNEDDFQKACRQIQDEGLLQNNAGEDPGSFSNE